MPKTKIILYQEADGKVIITEWMEGLPKKAKLKCISKIKRLSEMGHELRRPEADILTSGIYELRASFNGVNYRLLYFFHGEAVTIISHGITKEDRVPPIEIGHALRRKKEFQNNPEKHSSTLSYED